MLDKLLLNNRTFLNADSPTTFWGLVHPTTLQNGVDLSLAKTIFKNCYDLSKKMHPNRSDISQYEEDLDYALSILKPIDTGIEFGNWANNFQFEIRRVPAYGLNLTDEVIKEYNLEKSEDGLWLPGYWATHNLDNDAMRNLAMNFSFEYSNAVVKKKYSS